MTKNYSLTPYVSLTEMVAIFPFQPPLPLISLSCEPTSFTLNSVGGEEILLTGNRNCCDDANSGRRSDLNSGKALD